VPGTVQWSREGAKKFQGIRGSSLSSTSRAYESYKNVESKYPELAAVATDCYSISLRKSCLLLINFMFSFFKNFQYSKH